MSLRNDADVEDQPHISNIAGYAPGTMLRDVVPKHEKFWWNYPYLLKLNILLTGAILVNATNGYDGSLLNGLQALPQWSKYLGNPAGAVLGTVSNGTTFGTLASMPFVAYFCEKFGRRWPIIGGSFVIIIGAVVQSAAQDFAMFVVGRFVIGFGLGVIQTAAPLLISEVAYPTQRSKITSIIEPSFPLGALVAAWVTFGTFTINSTWAWRIPSLLQCVASFVQIGFCLFCPESPRWLVYHDRYEEARAVLVKYHSNNDPDSRLVDFEMAEIVSTLEAEKIQKASKWGEWLKTSGNRHRLLIVCFIPVIGQLSGNQIISYYLHIILNNIGITNSKTQLIINATIQIDQFVFAIIFALLVERVGRRKLFFWGPGGMLASLAIWTGLSIKSQQSNYQNQGYAKGVLAFIYIFEVFYHVSAPILPTYVVEVAPYALRSKASMIYQLFGAFAGVFNNYVNPIAMATIKSNYYFVFIGILCVQLVVIFFFFPETKGYSLEEIGTLFDGENAVLAGKAWTDNDINKPTVEHME